LTMENRKPVIGLQNQGNNFNIFTLGQTHSYNKQEIKGDVKLVWQQMKDRIQVAGSKLLRSSSIFINYIRNLHLH
jgi:hypothetical protein